MKNPDPWRHQLDAEARMRELDYHGMLAMEMGTGKTRVAMSLLDKHPGRRYLILCPKAVIGVWVGQAQQWLPDSIFISPRGSTSRRKMSSMDAAFLRSRHDTVAQVFNYESLSSSPVLRKYILGAKWDGVVCDESHRIGTARSATSRHVSTLQKSMSVDALRLCLTGTPFPASPLGIFGQYRFIDPTVFGYSWTRFRARYACLKMIPNVPVPIVDGYRNQDELRELFRSRAYVCRAADVLDLPAIGHQVITVELPPDVRRTYDTFKRNMIADIRGKIVTADNALTRFLRLQQIASHGKHRQDALRDLIDGMTGPVVVFCRFTDDLDQVREVSDKAGRVYCEVSGSRKDLTEHSTMVDIDNQVLGVQLQSGSVGIDLTRARFGVFWSKTMSLVDYKQAVARLHRPGQTQPVNFYHLQAERTIDEKIDRVMSDREVIIEELLKEYES